MTTTQTISTLTKVTINGETMKEIKNIIKKHDKRANKKFPILSNIKIELLSHSQIKVTHINYNGTQSIKTLDTIHNDYSFTPNTFLIPVDTIKAVKGIKKDSLYSFELLDSQIKFNNNGIIETLTVFDTSEYPHTTDITNFESYGTLSHSDLIKLKSANLSTSTSETRPILQTVCIRNNQLVSTDSHRLYKTNIDTIHSENDIIIHSNLIDSLLANENRKDFSATIKGNGQYTAIETYNAIYIHSSDCGNYPQIDRLLPDHYNHVFTIHNVEQFKNTVESIYTLTKNEKNHVMKIEIVDNYTLKITANNSVGETLETTIDIQSEYIEKGFNMSFSSKYLLEGIKQLNKVNSITFNIVSNMRPFTINSKEDHNTLALILPVRTY